MKQSTLHDTFKTEIDRLKCVVNAKWSIRICLKGNLNELNYHVETEYNNHKLMAGYCVPIQDDKPEYCRRGYITVGVYGIDGLVQNKIFTGRTRKSIEEAVNKAIPVLKRYAGM